MSFSLFIVKRPSYLGRSHLEITEALMSLALFDIEHKIVFFEQGISWLLKKQNPAEDKSLEKQLNALPLYGSEEIYFVEEHAKELLPGQALNEIAEAVTQDQLTDWIREAEHTEVFS